MCSGPNIIPPEGFDLYDTASERRERKKMERLREETINVIEGEFKEGEERLKKICEEYWKNKKEN